MKKPRKPRKFWIDREEEMADIPCDYTVPGQGAYFKPVRVK